MFYLILLFVFLHVNKGSFFPIYHEYFLIESNFLKFFIVLHVFWRKDKLVKIHERKDIVGGKAWEAESAAAKNSLAKN